MIRLAVCDDEQAVLDRVERFLAVYQEKAERCFSVFTFRSPSALLANIADGDDYDVYVLDIEMPELDGLTLAKAIREKQEHAVLIFLTSHNSIVITAESIKLEITRYVNKLTMEEDLPEALDVAIRKAEAQATRYLLVTPNLPDATCFMAEQASVFKRSSSSPPSPVLDFAPIKFMARARHSWASSESEP